MFDCAWQHPAVRQDHREERDRALTPTGSGPQEESDLCATCSFPGGNATAGMSPFALWPSSALDQICQGHNYFSSLQAIASFGAIQPEEVIIKNLKT